MRDFMSIETKIKSVNSAGRKKEIVSLRPVFSLTGTNFMKKGGEFYAFLQPDGFWTTKEIEFYIYIDQRLYDYRDEHYHKDHNGIYRDDEGREVFCETIDNSETHMLIEVTRWLSKVPPNHNFTPLDSSITFKGAKVKPEDYRSKTLSYDIKPGSIEAYEKLIGTLYSPSEKQKIEWAIGSVLAGDSKNIEKIVAFYGPPGSGKSTVLDLIKMMFEGYWTIFIASELASKSQQFATSVFKDNPLIAIQDDGSLAKIDSPAINEIVSHKEILINDKNVKRYAIRSNAMLFMATNELIDLHDTNLGLSRRLLDIYPSGEKIPVSEYRILNDQLKFEIGAIAQHCLDIYKELGKEAYINYKPNQMIKKVNYLHNFIFEYFDQLVENDPIRLSTLYSWYKEYYEESGLGYPPKRLVFKEQVKEFYEEFDEVKYIGGKTQRNVYVGFKANMFEYSPDLEITKKKDIPEWLKLNEVESLLDKELTNCKAQYANENDKPQYKWDNVSTVLSGIDTSKVHYILMPGNHIVIDFDYKNEKGEKDAKKNLMEAAKWPMTYAEYSKSGGGLHLHYIYTGDISLLANRINEDVEIKKFVGNASLRRKLSKCNDIPIATISSGLPLKKGGKKMLDFDGFKNEKQLLLGIEKCLRKEHHGATKPEVDFIKKMLDDAYSSGLSYDLTPMRPKILAFAMGSTNQKDICIKTVNQMKFKSDDIAEGVPDDNKPIIFYDVEVFPNLFLVNWKRQGKSSKVVRMINPSADEIEDLVKSGRLVGFNNRRYDNHILYARMMGYTNMGLFELSQRIVSGSKNAMFGDAYNLSYADVYDFASSYNKMSLKKWEIKLGLHHQELGLPWDQPVPKELWNKVAEYCDNDVISTEAVFDHLQGDFTCRKILAVLSGLTVNDSTNSHSKRIIFGNNRKPQGEFNYPDLSEMFPGYEFDAGKSTYMGEVVGEGGYVWAQPGIYANVITFDVASMHPTSIEQMQLFGPKYTKIFSDLKTARIHIKRNELDALGDLLDGKLVPFVQAIKDGTADYTIKDLSNALKTVINSIYGLTAAKFDNEFRDPRNIDNVVAKRGALFMVDLKNACLERGMSPIHIKTDSIKIVNPSEEDKKFIIEFGKKYGYEFEIESEYERICLVNDAVYIAREKDGKWTATGSEFAEPYIFKTVFSGEPLEYKDYWQTKESKKGDIFLDMNEELGEDEHDYKFVGRTGAFVPIKPGCGGGILLAQRGDKYVAVSGSKGYRWLDVEMVKALKKEKDIDEVYYEVMTENALKHISDFGDVDMFLDTSKALVNNYMEVPKGGEDSIPYFQD